MCLGAGSPALGAEIRVRSAGQSRVVHRSWLSSYSRKGTTKRTVAVITLQSTVKWAGNMQICQSLYRMHENTPDLVLICRPHLELSERLLGLQQQIRCRSPRLKRSR